MLRPKNRAIQKDCSGSSMGSDDTSDFDSSSVCYDAMSPSNVTVSLQPKSPRPQASRHASVGYTTAAKPFGGTSIGSPSFGSVSTAVSQTPSLAESIGSFDADKVQTEERKALVRANPRRLLICRKAADFLRATQVHRLSRTRDTIQRHRRRILA